jgi:hypothetical protein
LWFPGLQRKNGSNSEPFLLQIIVLPVETKTWANLTTKWV